MLSMSVTLDVSMLSGWLKAVASCERVASSAGRVVRGPIYRGAGRPRGARTACREEGTTAENVQRMGGIGRAREQQT